MICFAWMSAVTCPPDCTVTECPTTCMVPSTRPAIATSSCARSSPLITSVAPIRAVVSMQPPRLRNVPRHLAIAVPCSSGAQPPDATLKTRRDLPPDPPRFGAALPCLSVRAQQEHILPHPLGSPLVCAHPVGNWGFVLQAAGHPRHGRSAGSDATQVVIAPSRCHNRHTPEASNDERA